jgi:hypothetical protein
MAESKFTPIFNLNELNQDQRNEYYLAACKYFGVPPELNVLRLTYVDNQNGPANLVLCATKGATDIIRNNLKISVKGLTDKQVNGSYVVTATGENKDGRQEMSFGSFYIDGLKGKDLDIAIMTAQTRALKRMTLQFAGGGLADESEVDMIATTATHKAQVPQTQPAAKPNAAPGEEFVRVTGDPAKDFPKDARLVPTKAQLEAQRVLAGVNPEVLAKASSEARDAVLQEISSVSQNPPNEGVSLQVNAAVPAQVNPVEPRRRKREKATFNKPFSLDAAVSAPVSPITDIPESKPLLTVPPLQPAGTVITVAEPIVLPPAKVEEIKKEKLDVVAQAIGLPDPVKVNELRTQLFKYTNELLPKSGLVSDEGAPAAMKFRKFVVNRYKGLASLNHLTIDQWNDLYSFMDSYLNEGRGAELVKVINESWTNA